MVSHQQPSPDVHVVLVTHNGAAHLEEQVRSIAEQLLVPAGVLLVDDRSCDDSVEIVMSLLEAADIRCTQVPTPDVGEADLNTRIAANFEAGLRAAPAGSLVAFCDQDDVWYPHHLAELRAALVADPVRAYAFSNALFIAEDGAALPGSNFASHGVPEEFGAWTGFRQLRTLTTRSLVTGMTMMVRRDRVLPIFPTPPGLLHDRWISLATCPRGGGTAISTALSAYRQHPDQVIGAVKGADILTRFTSMIRRAARTRGRTVFLTDLSLIELTAMRQDPALHARSWTRILDRFSRIVTVKQLANRAVLRATPQSTGPR